MHYFNPLNVYYKSITGAIQENTPVIFRLKSNDSACYMVVIEDSTKEEFRYEMKKDNDTFFVELSFSVGLKWYYFELSNGKKLGKGENYNAEIQNKINFYQLTVYSRDYKVPSWLKGGVIYQIFPDRFYKSEKYKINTKKFVHENWFDTPVYKPNEDGQVLNNDFFGGNIQGIIEKLDYLKSLSVNAIYLNPIFKAFSNHRYDTGDYFVIDELLGDENDLIELIEKANRKGIKIILDGVFNHVGDDSIYFNKYGNYDSVGAYQNTNSKYYSWFNFIDYPNDYESWWGIKTLPQVDKNNIDYINFICGENGVIERYTKLGIGGWRLDVVDELNGNFVKKLRERVKTNNKNAIIIGEVWEDASNKVSYGERREYFLGKELDSVMNYPLKNAILEYVTKKDEKALLSVVLEQLNNYPKIVLDSLMNILSTHDTIRLISALSGININGLTKEQQEKIKLNNIQKNDSIFLVKIASLLQFTLYGVPSIYYGDEVGMEGFTDPLNRMCFPWKNENVVLLNWYKFLGKLRKNYKAFNDGEISILLAKNGAFVFKRENINSNVLVCVNLSNDEINLSFDGEVKELISTKVFNNSAIQKTNSFGIYVKN